MKKTKRYLILLLCVLSVFLTGCGTSSYLQTKQEDDDNIADVTGEAADTATGEGASDVIYVQVAGAVANPGVYSFASGARIFEAIEAAGGLSEDADESSLNQAQELSDGQKLYVLTADEVALAEQENKTEDDGRININTASEAELMQLSGIGEAKAALIVQYRTEHGSFSSIEEIKQVEGIKEGTYQKICNDIKI